MGQAATQPSGAEAMVATTAGRAPRHLAGSPGIAVANLPSEQVA